MSARSFFAPGHLAHPARLALLLFLTLLAVLLGYHLQRAPFVDLGSLGDAPLLSDFHADEADLSYRYRWTTAHSEVSFAGAGGAGFESLLIRAQGARPGQAPRPVTMSLSLGGSPLQPVVATLSADLRDYSFGIAPGLSPPSGPNNTVAIGASTFQPPGDSRLLGVKIDRIEMRQAGSGLNLPPLSMLFWPLALAAGLYVLLLPTRGALSLLSLIAVPLLLFLAVLGNQLYAAAYLPPIAAATALLGILAWQRDHVRRFPHALDALRAGSLPRLLMGLALLAYAIVALMVLPRVDWIGHADYAENAVIARNLISGKGLTVDYLAQFYRDPGPNLTHPADTWPLLQPLMIAPFVAIFGPQTWAAKLPNLFLQLALAWLVFHVASRLWDGRVGLFAGLLTLLHPYFFNAVLYPINDLAFTLIFFALSWLLWRGLARLLETGFTGFGRLSLALIGSLAALLIWSKPSGAVLLLGLALWLLWAWRSHLRAWRLLPRGPLLILGAAFALVLAPLIIRNLLAFGVPFFSTESYDAWILRYWPLYEWENIYRFYIGTELPHPRWLLGGKFGYQNLIDAVTTNFAWVWQKGVLGSPGQGDYVMGLLPLSAALVGLAASPPLTRRFFGMAAFSIALYALFVLIYWHYEGRYFQVAVPWLYMLLAYGVFWLWDRLRGIGDRESGIGSRFSDKRVPRPLIPDPRLPAAFLLIATLGFLTPSLLTIRDQIEADTLPTGFVRGMEWLRQNTDPTDIVMTRDPWELNWYTDRKAVMVPFDDLATIEATARRYNATILQLGGPVDGINVRNCPSPNETGSRPALDGLYCGLERPGYTLLYRDRGLTIYRLTQE